MSHPLEWQWVSSEIETLRAKVADLEAKIDELTAPKSPASKVRSVSWEVDSVGASIQIARGVDAFIAPSGSNYSAKVIIRGEARDVCAKSLGKCIAEVHQMFETAGALRGVLIDTSQFPYEAQEGFHRAMRKATK